MVFSFLAMIVLLPVEMTVNGLIALRRGVGRPVLPQPSMTVLGVRVDNLTIDEAVRGIVARIERGERAESIYFVNADCLNIAFRDKRYREILARADYVLADGSGVRLAGKLVGVQVRENVNGTDLFPRLCEGVSGMPGGIYLYGAAPGVAEGTADWIRKHYSQTRIAGVEQGFLSEEEANEMPRRIRESGADVLLVAFGAPRQEEWIDRHVAETGVATAMGVGGLFDFYSGRIPRAPDWMRRAGLEWAFRLMQEPRRMARRYLLGNPLFLWRIFWYGSHRPGGIVK